MRPAQKAPENFSNKVIVSLARPSFNEAGAKSAGKLPERCLHASEEEWASMRPAQKAPENDRSKRGPARRGIRASMRPAQKAPENTPIDDERECDVFASMRPAQKAPENHAVVPAEAADRLTLQ